MNLPGGGNAVRGIFYALTQGRDNGNRQMKNFVINSGMNRQKGSCGGTASFLSAHNRQQKGGIP